jgi:hypothetical protein
MEVIYDIRIVKVPTKKSLGFLARVPSFEQKQSLVRLFYLRTASNFYTSEHMKLTNTVQCLLTMSSVTRETTKTI